MKINAQIVLEMLRVRFSSLNTEGFRRLAMSDGSSIEMLTGVFVAGVRKQLSRGLEREYNPYQELLTTVRGSIDVNASMKDFTLEKRKIWCQYDEYSFDGPRNRIIKNMLEKLEVCDELSKQTRDDVSKVLVEFGSVGKIRQKDWQLARMKSSRGRDGYALLLSICDVIGKCMIGEHGNIQEFCYDQRFMEVFKGFVFDSVQQAGRDLGLDSWFTGDGVLTVDDRVGVMVGCMDSENSKNVFRLERELNAFVKRQLEFVKTSEIEGMEYVIIIGYNNHVKIDRKIYRCNGKGVMLIPIPICSSRFLFSSAYSRAIGYIAKCLRKV